MRVPALPLRAFFPQRRDEAVEFRKVEREHARDSNAFRENLFGFSLFRESGMGVFDRRVIAGVLLDSA